MPTRKRLTRIHPLSAAKVGSLLYSGLGLIAALFFAAAPDLAPEGVTREALIFLPFFNALAGFFGGALLAGFYNLIAGTIGGIVFDVDEVSSQAKEQSPSGSDWPR
jgi:hypothetical protein